MLNPRHQTPQGHYYLVENLNIDYVLLRKTFHKHVRDVKGIPGEEIAKHHHLLVCDFRADIPPPLRRNSSPA